MALTYFEFGTLAALWLFARADLDAWVLEVGLGGRLDAVNIIDADVAIVTSVAIDHIDYLGTTREKIGREKAGIFRAGAVAICADRDPPLSLVAHADAIGAVAAHRRRLRLHRERADGATGAPAVRVTACRSRRCVELTNSRTRRRR